ncbi:PF32 (plasmid) [Borreliella afzelii ACA-1]|nr:PF32 [Borreliella afzelii ACA-1]
MDQKNNYNYTSKFKRGGWEKLTFYNFFYILKELGKKVLLIDLDPQNSLTSYFN